MHHVPLQQYFKDPIEYALLTENTKQLYYRKVNYEFGQIVYKRLFQKLYLSGLEFANMYQTKVNMNPTSSIILREDVQFMIFKVSPFSKNSQRQLLYCVLNRGAPSTFTIIGYNVPLATFSLHFQSSLSSCLRCLWSKFNLQN